VRKIVFSADFENTVQPTNSVESGLTDSVSQRLDDFRAFNCSVCALEPCDLDVVFREHYLFRCDSFVISKLRDISEVKRAKSIR
jgi:hypothetical protein